MATRGDELNTRITASDDASAVVDRVAEKVGDLEDREHDIDLDADTSDAERDVRALDERLDGLTGEERRVVLEFAARDAQRQIDRVNRELARAERYDDTEIDIRVNARGDAQRRLDAIQSEIRDLDGATPDIRPEVDSSSLDEFIEKLDDLTGGNIGGLGNLRGRGGLALGGAVAAGFVLAGNAAANAAIDIDNVSKLTGDSVENASKLAGIMGRAGVESKDLQDILLQMGGVLQDDAELASRLGINLDDGRTLGERFLHVVELLGERFTDTSERSLVASRLFGEEGVRQVNAVTAAYGDLNEAVDQYSGSVFTDEDVANARNYQRELAELRDEFVQLRNEIGSDLLPVLGEALGTINEINEIGGTEGGLLGSLFNSSGFSLLNSYNGAVIDLGKSILGAEDNTERLYASTRRAGRGGRDAMTEMSDAADIINREIELAISNFERFGSDGKEAMNDVGEAADTTAGKVDGVASALDEVLGRLSEEAAVNQLADQWDRVLEAQTDYLTAEKNGTPEAIKAQRDYRDELFRLAVDVGRFAEQVGDIPEERLTRLALALESNSLADIERALDEIFSDRMIRLDVNTADPTRFRRTDDGRWERVTSGSTSTVDIQPTPTVNHNTYWTITPTPSATDEALREFQFANGGSRAR